MTKPSTISAVPDSRGRFGAFGGVHVPETLMAALAELEREYARACEDDAFTNELGHLFKTFVGRPTPLYRADRLREELNELLYCEAEPEPDGLDELNADEKEP